MGLGNRTCSTRFGQVCLLCTWTVEVRDLRVIGFGKFDIEVWASGNAVLGRGLKVQGVSALEVRFQALRVSGSRDSAWVQDAKFRKTWVGKKDL